MELPHYRMASRISGPSDSTDRRCIVTAHSTLTAIGASATDALEALRCGTSGLREPSFGLPFRTALGEVRDLPTLPPRFAGYESRVNRMALALADGVAGAVERARRRAGRDRVALVVGTSTGGLERSEAQLRSLVTAGRPLDGYDFERQHAMHAMLEVLGDVLDVGGPRYVISTACASGAKAFAAARRLIRAGVVDAAVVGGIDGLCETTVRGFHALGILAEAPCRPFSAERSGLSIGEGGALAVLDARGEGATELLGAGESTDAFHLSAPDPDGAGAVAAMRAALADAGALGERVDHVNAHGTGTRQNDAVEARAIAAVLGGAVPVTSTKPLTGHLLGAAGAVEAVFSMLAIENGFVPATVGVEPRGPEITVNVARSTVLAPQSLVLSSSFAFGGINASLLFGGTR